MRPSTARKSRKASASGRRPCPTVLCFPSKGRALPPTGASLPRRAIASRDFSIPACSSLATASGRCCGNSRRRRNSRLPISANSSNCCRRKSTAGASGTWWKCATPVFSRRISSRSRRRFGTPVVFTDHARYPSLADATGDFIYARLQKGEDAIPTAYPPKELDAWSKRLRVWAQGEAPEDLPHVDASPAPAKATPRDVFAYVIHEGKIRAPAAAMALIERLKKRA